MGASGVSATLIQLTDRGDPAAFDKTEADLTMDGSWHDLDLSAIVTDTDASLILLRVVLNDANIADNIVFRKNGNSNAINTPGVVAQVANQDVEGQFFVACDSSQVIEYKANAALGSCDIVVCGWVA